MSHHAKKGTVLTSIITFSSAKRPCDVVRIILSFRDDIVHCASASLTQLYTYVCSTGRSFLGPILRRHLADGKREECLSLIPLSYTPFSKLLCINKSSLTSVVIVVERQVCWIRPFFKRLR